MSVAEIGFWGFVCGMLVGAVPMYFWMLARKNQKRGSDGKFVKAGGESKAKPIPEELHGTLHDPAGDIATGKYAIYPGRLHDDPAAHQAVTPTVPRETSSKARDWQGIQRSNHQEVNEKEK